MFKASQCFKYKTICYIIIHLFIFKNFDEQQLLAVVWAIDQVRMMKLIIYEIILQVQ